MNRPRFYIAFITICLVLGFGTDIGFTQEGQEGSEEGVELKDIMEKLEQGQGQGQRQGRGRGETPKNEEAEILPKLPDRTIEVEDKIGQQEINLDKDMKGRMYKKFSQDFSVDVKTIEDVEKTVAEVGMTPKQALMLIVLARNRTNALIASGKFTKEQDRQVMQDSINYIWQKLRADTGNGWGDIAQEVGLHIKDVRQIVIGYYDEIRKAKSQN